MVHHIVVRSCNAMQRVMYNLSKPQISLAALPDHVEEALLGETLLLATTTENVVLLLSALGSVLLDLGSVSKRQICLLVRG
jgi:hypothetical protein